MRYKVLGRTGLRVSELCMGAMTFGGSGGIWDAIGGLDATASANLVARALDAGINFFDTANAYANGTSEEYLGKALGKRRSEVVIVTKVGFPMGTGPNDRGSSRGHILSAVDASLKALGTDYIDVYMLHTPDIYTPIEETLRVLNDLVRWGKVRYLGVSNYPAWQMMKACSISERHDWTRFEVVQSNYNLAARDLEREIVPFLQDQQLGLMVWSPLAGGALTGKYGPDGKPPEGARRTAFDIGPVNYDRVNRIMAVAREIATAHQATVPQVTLAWLLAQNVVTSVILGAKRPDQLEDNLGAVNVALSPDELQRLTEASDLPIEYPGWYTKQFAGV